MDGKVLSALRVDLFGNSKAAPLFPFKGNSNNSCGDDTKSKPQCQLTGGRVAYSGIALVNMENRKARITKDGILEE